MQDMLLHWSPRSPFVRKVMIVAHELGLAERVKTVRTVVAASTPSLELMKENPQSRLPTMRLADGTVIYDSRVICEYLDQLQGGKLFPKTYPARLTALRWQALGDGMLDTLLSWRGEQLRPSERRSGKHIDAWKVKTITSIDELESEADALTAMPFSIGQIGIGCALGYLDFRFAELAWRTGRPKLATWHGTFVARPSVRATEPVDEP